MVKLETLEKRLKEYTGMTAELNDFGLVIEASLGKFKSSLTVTELLDGSAYRCMGSIYLKDDWYSVELVGFFNEETNEITVRLKMSNDEKVLLHGVVTETNMYSVIKTIGDICKEFSDTFYTIESSNSWLAEK